MKSTDEIRGLPFVNPDVLGRSTIVETKNRVSAVRTLRDGVAQLAMMLADQPVMHGYLLLLDPLLSLHSIADETRRLKAVMRADIADRLKLVVVKKGEIVQQESDFLEEDPELLRRHVNEAAVSGSALQGARKQDEVFLVILHRWVTGQGPMESRWAERQQLPALRLRRLRPPARRL